MATDLDPSNRPPDLLPRRDHLCSLGRRPPMGFEPSQGVHDRLHPMRVHGTEHDVRSDPFVGLLVQAELGHLAPGTDVAVHAQRTRTGRLEAELVSSTV